MPFGGRRAADAFGRRVGRPHRIEVAARLVEDGFELENLRKFARELDDAEAEAEKRAQATHIEGNRKARRAAAREADLLAAERAVDRARADAKKRAVEARKRAVEAKKSARAAAFEARRAGGRGERRGPGAAGRAAEGERVASPPEAGRARRENSCQSRGSGQRQRGAPPGFALGSDPPVYTCLTLVGEW